MPSPMDLPDPDDDAYDLVYPFTACTSQGGPYDDDAFAAGVQLGRLDMALTAAAAVGASRVRHTVRSTMVKQSQLCGMARGYSRITDEPWDGTWSSMLFERDDI